MESWYVSGLCDGEATFSISFNYRKKLNTGIEVRPSFSLSLNKRDLRLLEELQRFFGVGFIRFSKRDNCYKYEVRNLDDLKRVVIPHFQQFPLTGAKNEDFEKFSQLVKMMKGGLHLSNKFLPEIIELASQMNPLGKRKHSKDELLRYLVR